MDRRSFLRTAAVGTVSLGAAGVLLGRKDSARGRTRTTRPRPQATGPVRTFRLRAEETEVDLGSGQPFRIWTYNGQLPGPEIRVTEGELVRVEFENRLPQPTTIHWHGIPVPNPMDGVPGLTQSPIQPGERFVYEFPAWPAGTYIYHSHQGYQLDQGLYGAIIIEPGDGGRTVDREYVLTLEDWVRFDGGPPAAARAGRIRSSGMGMMRGGGGMMGRGMMGRGRRSEGNSGSVPL